MTALFSAAHIRYPAADISALTANVAGAYTALPRRISASMPPTPAAAAPYRGPRNQPDSREKMSPRLE